jgi:quercetin dioxygenase-like cupin family protein
MVKMQFAEDATLSALPKSTFDKVEFSGVEVYRFTFDPGWKWTEHAGPFAGVDSCPVPHIIFTISGRLAVKMDDGSTEEVGEGECIVIPPGHDAWTVGDQAFVGIDLGPQIYENLQNGASGNG